MALMSTSLSSQGEERRVGVNRMTPGLKGPQEGESTGLHIPLVEALACGIGPSHDDSPSEGAQTEGEGA